MAARRNSTIGELKGKMETLLDEVLPRIEGRIGGIEKSLSNHLKHHEQAGEKRSDRWFQIGMVVLQVALTGMVLYLLATR